MELSKVETFRLMETFGIENFQYLIAIAEITFGLAFKYSSDFCNI